MHRILTLLLLVCANVATASDQIPGATLKRPIALVGGMIHPVSSEPVHDGTVVFEKGRITLVGRRGDVRIPENAEVIDLEGQHVYPGLFDAHTILGLSEICSVRATQDASESGAFNPNVRAHVAVNPDSELIPVTRANGVLLALSAPEGGTISGLAAVLQLDGWTYEQMTVNPAAGMVVTWPGVPDGLTDGGTSDRLREIRKWFDDARAYELARKESHRQRTDLKLEALLPVLERKVPLIVRADGLSTIQSAVAFCVEQKVRLIILGGYDAPLCAELLKQHDVPVIVSAVYRLPRRSDDGFDAAYTLPERLRQAGIKFCISGSDTSRTSNVRNLPYHAATAVAYGLPEDDALRAITLSPAEILGVAEQLGSLETGKDATLIVTTGNPLDTFTAVTAAWIQGRPVDLSSRHTLLNDKYQEKYRQLREAGSDKR